MRSESTVTNSDVQSRRRSAASSPHQSGEWGDERWFGDKVTATAGTQLTTCTGFDEAAVSSFRDEYRARGPDVFPLDSLAPGT